MGADPPPPPPKYQPPSKLVERPGNVQLNNPNTLRMPNDPEATGTPKWFETGGAPPMQPIRDDNDVTMLIDGTESFQSMVDAIRTATGGAHYVYLLGWIMQDGFETIPGDAASTILSLFTAASTAGVQVRAMLWDQAGRTNTPEVNRINGLTNGAAILDNRTLNFGSHHQKVLIVKGTQGLITFCGGVDFNRDRIATITAGLGQPMHDVHCKIVGPAAFDLLQIFIQRWNDHPSRSGGVLLGASETVPPAVAGGRHAVQIGRTYPNGNRHGGIDSDRLGTRPRGYSFAPDGEDTAWRLIRKGIREARRFIYMEEQYLVSMEASRELQAALPNIQHLTILIPQGSISDLPQVHFRRRAFIAPLRAAGGAKVRVFFLSPAGDPHTYVHAKTWVFDDQYAVIGSANCNRRGYTHDSEVVAGIFEPSSSTTLAQHFAHKLRIKLWAEHLNLNTPAGRAQLNDGVAGAVHWLHPPSGAHVSPYDETINIERIHTDRAWDTAEDPDGS